MRWPVFRCFFWGGFSECNDMAFPPLFFRRLATSDLGAGGQNTRRKLWTYLAPMPKTEGEWEGFRGFACVAKVGGVFLVWWFYQWKWRFTGLESFFWDGFLEAQHGALGKSSKYLLRNCPMMPLGFWPFAFLRAGCNWPHLLINWEQWISHLRSNECIQQFMPVASSLVMKWSYQLSDVISYHKLQWF